MEDKIKRLGVIFAKRYTMPISNDLIMEEKKIIEDLTNSGIVTSWDNENETTFFFPEKSNWKIFRDAMK